MVSVEERRLGSMGGEVADEGFRMKLRWLCDDVNDMGGDMGPDPDLGGVDV